MKNVKSRNARRGEAYSEHSQTSKMEHFPKIVNSWKPLIIMAKSSILDVWQGSEYASGEISDYIRIARYLDSSINVHIAVNKDK